MCRLVQIRIFKSYAKRLDQKIFKNENFPTIDYFRGWSKFKACLSHAIEFPRTPGLVFLDVIENEEEKR